MRDRYSRWIGRVILVLALPMLVGAAGEGPEATTAKTKTVRLLTVGNSFSRNATNYLPDVVNAAGDVLIHHQAAIGGGTLEQHWEKYQRHEADPNDPRGLYSTKKGLKQELVEEPWDFITFQQASIKSHDVTTYRPFARLLVEQVHARSPHAKVLMHETWAYRRDDPRFAVKKPAPGEPNDQEAMYRGLSHAYRLIADELGAGVIPVGDAFYAADSDPVWGYRPDASFDFAKASFPALPKQTHSLHKGWTWSKKDDGRYELGIDGHHANVAGEYLGACVFYEALYEKSIVGNGFRPRGINADYARFLQETAHRIGDWSRELNVKAKAPAEATR